MKKWALVIVLFIFLAALSIYILLPGKANMVAFSKAAINPKALNRHLNREDGWKQCWPAQPAFRYGNWRFQFNKALFNGAEIMIQSENDSLMSRVAVIPLGIDSCGIEWTFPFEGSAQPIRRIKRYLEARSLRQALDSILSSVRRMYTDEVNLYGFRVEEIKVTDSLLVSTSQVFDHEPADREVEGLVEELRNYIRDQGAMASDYPMLNINETSPGSYRAKVAIAVDRVIPETPRFAPKIVLRGGNILVAEVHGGPATIRQAWKNFELYKSDHERRSPAIPYQLMVTDRVKETDTSKWVTRLYYPVL